MKYEYFILYNYCHLSFWDQELPCKSIRSRFMSKIVLCCQTRNWSNHDFLCILDNFQIRSISLNFWYLGNQRTHSNHLELKQNVKHCSKFSKKSGISFYSYRGVASICNKSIAIEDPVYGLSFLNQLSWNAGIGLEMKRIWWRLKYMHDNLLIGNH